MNIQQLYQYYIDSRKVSTDSRNIPQQCIFFALKGESFNGNTFALQALEKGASYAVIDEPQYYIDHRTILVEDVLTTLQKLSAYHRKQLSIPVFAIAGSNGKTTSKELIHAVLQTKYKTSATKGNLNNHIGVPLTLLEITPDVEIAIVEIGANHQQETYDLCKIAMPTMGVVTNNGKDHLEGFGSIEGVRKANGELFQYLKENHGTVFVFADMPDLMEDSQNINRVTYGSVAEAKYQFTLIEKSLFASIGYNNQNITSHLAGHFNWINMALAFTVGSYFNIDISNIKQALESYQPRLNRSQIIKLRGATIVMDAYNANPSSMQLAIESFMKLTGEKKCVILADMLEMGDYAEQEHLAMVNLLSQHMPDQVVLIGPEFGKWKDKILCLHFINTADAAKWFSSQEINGWNILLKGSRGFQLEKIISV